jgi:hypothetical protein
MMSDRRRDRNEMTKEFLPGTADSGPISIGLPSGKNVSTTRLVENHENCAVPPSAPAMVASPV